MTLIVDELDIGYSGFCLLSKVSFTLKSGEVLTITGQNGIGKSTLLVTIAGLISPLHGQIHNQFFSTLYLPVRHPIHMTLNVEENLTYWKLLTRGSDHQALRYFNLEALRHEPCAHLSAGQLQRLHLCRLMLDQSPLWLLDEPYQSLDDEGYQLVNQLIDNHLEKGGAVLIAQATAACIGHELTLRAA
jgi:heme exporter protein A